MAAKQMSAFDAGDDAAKVAALHHEAFLVEMFGESSTTPDRLSFLIKKGYLKRSDVGRLGLKTSAGLMDPVEFVIQMSAVMSSAPPESVQKMRRWPVKKWIGIIGREIASQPDGGAEDTIGVPTTNKPLPPESVTEQMAAMVPERLGTSHRAAYEQARERSGEYVRGLGNKISEDGRSIVMEAWKEEDIVRPVDELKRQATIDEIRAETSDGVLRGKAAKKVASNLGHKTGEWSRDWLRIAQTEMQGAYNDGQVIGAVKIYGDRAMVARVPEPSACQHCKSLFIQEGKPAVFLVRDLVENGTNVGRKAPQWQATIWPVHPNCRCDTQVVPPNFAFNDDWILVAEVFDE